MPRMSKLGAHRSSRDVPGAAFAFFVDLKIVHLSCAVCAAANDAPCGTSSIAGKGSSASPVPRPPTGLGTSVNGSGKLPVLSRQAQPLLSLLTHRRKNWHERTLKLGVALA